MSLVSHRGAAGLAPENSKKAIIVARAYYPKYIEIDVHCTFDGVFVVYHGHVSQTYTGHRLSETFQVLSTKVPDLLTLREMLVGHAGTAAFMLDVKCADDVGALVQFLKEHSFGSMHVFTSPHTLVLIELKKYFPNNQSYIAQKFSKGPFKAYSLARKHNFSGISINKWWLNPITYIACRVSRKSVMAYTVDSKIGMRFLQTMYPKSLICTNYPDVYRSVYSQDSNRKYIQTKVKE